MKIIKLEDIKNIPDDQIFDYFKNVVVIPTETVYGLAARIDNINALKDIYMIKGRPTDNPLIIHVSSEKMLMEYIDGEIPIEYRKLIDKFWPGPLSLLFKAKECVPRIVTGSMSMNVVARMPYSKDLRDMIERIGVPLAAPSANKSGRPSPTELNHILDDLKNDVEVFIDGGRCHKGLESTIFGIIDSKCTLLRPGNITKEEIENVLGVKIDTRTKVKDNEKIVSPGQKYKHYSPIHPFYLFRGDNWKENMESERLRNKDKRIGFLIGSNVFFDSEGYDMYDLGRTLEECAYNLFDGLIELDRRCDIIFAKEFEECNLGFAIMDRLCKAASKIIE